MSRQPSPTSKQLAELLVLPLFETRDYVPSRVATKANLFAPHVWDEHLSAFVNTLYRHNLIMPFNWSSWQSEAEAYFEHPERLQHAPAEDIWKLLTLHVRKDRFFDGHLPHMVEAGHIAALLRRLESHSKRPPHR